MELIELIGQERDAVADTLEALSDADWSTPSLCGSWTVKEVAAHLIQPFEITMPAFLKGLVLAKGSFDRANASFAQRIAAVQSNEYLVRTLRENRYHRFTPPGLGLEAPLTDVVVHGEDIRRPLGGRRSFGPDVMGVVLGFMTSGKAKALVPKGRIDGLAFEAPDVAWRHGTGAIVSGPSEALVMALAGRVVALDDLQGDGLPLLRSRLSA